MSRYERNRLNQAHHRDMRPRPLPDERPDGARAVWQSRDFLAVCYLDRNGFQRLSASVAVEAEVVLARARRHAGPARLPGRA